MDEDPPDKGFCRLLGFRLEEIGEVEAGRKTLHQQSRLVQSDVANRMSRIPTIEKQGVGVIADAEPLCPQRSFPVSSGKCRFVRDRDIREHQSSAAAEICRSNFHFMP